MNYMYQTFFYELHVWCHYVTDLSYLFVWGYELYVCWKMLIISCTILLFWWNDKGEVLEYFYQLVMSYRLELGIKFLLFELSGGYLIYIKKLYNQRWILNLEPLSCQTADLLHLKARMQVPFRYVARNYDHPELQVCWFQVKDPK